jgi:hypothetical protein
MPIKAINAITKTTREVGIKNSATPNGGKVEKAVKMSADANVTNKPMIKKVTEIHLLLAVRKFTNHARRSSVPAKIRLAILDSHRIEAMLEGLVAVCWRATIQRSKP